MFRAANFQEAVDFMVIKHVTLNGKIRITCGLISNQIVLLQIHSEIRFDIKDRMKC